MKYYIDVTASLTFGVNAESESEAMEYLKRNLYRLSVPNVETYSAELDARTPPVGSSDFEPVTEPIG